MGVDGFVLAGGQSRRMGQDKAVMCVGSRSLLEWALQKLRAVPLQTPPRIAGRPADSQTMASVVPDIHPGCGPLSGIQAAMAASVQPLGVFLPVDMPLLPVAFLRWMLSRAHITGALATVPRVNGLPQPLCAVYHRQLQSAVSIALNTGHYKVMPVMSAAASRSGTCDIFDVESVASANSSFAGFSPLPVHRWFHNCNTPGDMAGLENALVFSQ